jgi:predicted GH43/DUF377 family glycosyl hydrolase
MEKFKKIGFVFNCLKDAPEWLLSHAIMPLALEKEECFRIYFTGRHKDGKSRISFFDIDKRSPDKLLYVHQSPILEVGAKGTFDDCGTVGTFVMEHENKVYLYYNGYNVRNTVPWSNSIGLAVSKDGGETFEKAFKGPILDRNTLDPYFVISPSVLIIDNKWHMWYTSGTGWLDIDNRVEPVYNIKHATSEDGINWLRPNTVAIEQENFEECVARASVIRDGDKLKMWFIYRGSRDFRDGIDSYRIGYAESDIKSPHDWVRMDKNNGILPGPEKYDDKMQAYANVIQANGKKYMFYNGNSFGKEGVLLAIS